MYEYTDKHIEEIKKKVKALFNNTRLGLMKYDELNVSQIDDEVTELYDSLQKQSDKLIDGLLDELADKRGIKRKKYSKEKIYDTFNPTTHYVFKNEIERKRARYKETIVSSLFNRPEFAGKRKDFNHKTVVDALANIVFLKIQDANIRNIDRQIEETAIDAERTVIIEDGIDNGEQFVRWITMEDERVCGECGDYHNQIFHIDALPPRPHAGCRCEFEFVSQEEYEKEISK